MCPLSGESVFNKASRQSTIPTCELHRRDLRDGGNRGTLEELGGGGHTTPSCYYLYSIAKHASGNQHEIVNCSAHLCVAQGTRAFRRFAPSERGAARLTACTSQGAHMTLLALAPSTTFARLQEESPEACSTWSV